MVERLAERVDRAGADVAVHDAERAERQSAAALRSRAVRPWSPDPHATVRPRAPSATQIMMPGSARPFPSFGGPSRHQRRHRRRIPVDGDQWKSVRQTGLQHRGWCLTTLHRQFRAGLEPSAATTQPRTREGAETGRCRAALPPRRSGSASAARATSGADGLLAPDPLALLDELVDPPPAQPLGLGGHSSQVRAAGRRPSRR